MKHMKPTKFLIFTFMLLGIIFSCIALVINGVNIHIRNHYVPIEATITGFDSHQMSRDDSGDIHTCIEYTLGGNRYATVIASYNSAWRIGDTITVYANPDNMQHITTPAPIVVGVVFQLVGAVAIIISICFWLKERKLAKKRRDLIENGLTLRATVVDFSINYNLAVNQRHPFIIEVEYEEFGTKHRFKSGNVWQNITPHELGKAVTVYYQHNNMDNYYVDTDALFEQENKEETDIVYH